MATSPPEFEFDIALSFAGEDRHYVERIAHALRNEGIRVFFDQFAEADLWGDDLIVYLDEVYRTRARFVVEFISHNYVRKQWTNHERRSAQARALLELGPYFLPVKMDDAELPGLQPTIGYIDARRTSEAHLVELILAKLKKGPPLRSEPSSIMGVPTTPEEQQQLLRERPPAWEHLLFAGLLIQGKKALEPKWRDHELRYFRHSGQTIHESEVITFIQGELRHSDLLVANVERILSPRATELAFGRPGEEGDPAKIEHLAISLLGIYEGLLDWASRVRGTTTTSHELTAVLIEPAAVLMDKPIQQFREFIESIYAQVDPLPRRLAASPDEPIEIEFMLRLEMDERAAKQYLTLLDDVARHQRRRRR